jgi:twitching motility protein PilI|tara:strand:- start:3970 stop:4512 length:543 start_codon:yes stop_codon:yes gene_type:complete
MSRQNALAVLSALARRSEQIAIELPAKEIAQTHWNGLGFSLLGQRFVTPMNEVAELMRLPASTRLPGVKPFVIGIANIRGRLMALLDLAAFLGASSSLPRVQRRVLAVEDEEHYFGFLVDESLGMQHFPSDAYAETIDEVDLMFQPFIKGGYRVAGAVWPVMSLKALAADPGLETLSSQT